MLKNNKKGFALMETLIVTVFVAVVFSFLYINVIPIMASYEAEERYSSVDLKYIGNLVKNDFSYYRSYDDNDKKNIVDSEIKTRIKDNGYFDITSLDGKINDIYIHGKDRTRYEYLKDLAGIERVYIVSYDLTELKNKIKNGTVAFDCGVADNVCEDISSQTKAYIESLPTFSDTLSNASYRLIIATRDIYENDTLYYGTIEYDF